MKLFCKHLWGAVLIGRGTKGVWLCEHCGASKSMSKHHFHKYFMFGVR